MNEVTWIKLATGIFKNEKIVLLFSMPEGDTIFIIWIEILIIAGTANNGGYLTLCDDMPYTEEMLADVIKRPLGIIRLALSTFIKFKMIENTLNGIFIVNWEKYQNVDGLEKIREKNRIRNIAYRNKKRLALGHNDVMNDITEMPNDGKEKDRDENIDQDNIFNYVINYLNGKCGMQYKTSSKNTKDLIGARQKESYKLNDFKMVIDLKCESWLHDEKMRRYLRPETLFGPKFESYLNERPGNERNETNNNFSGITSI